jgi:ParB-like chromosome segregation protein Spo0J
LKKKVNIASVKENPKINYVEDNLENRFYYSLKKLISILLVKENPDNPRFIKDSKFKKLVKSIKAFPEMLEKRPIVVDENMVVLGGNMRLKACKSAGLFEVWIDIAQGWTEEQKQEFIVKDNVGFGEWDWDILANEWDVQKLVEWGVDLPVYDVPIDDDQDDKNDRDKEVCELCGK